MCLLNKGSTDNITNSQVCSDFLNTGALPCFEDLVEVKSTLRRAVKLILNGHIIYEAFDPICCHWRILYKSQ